MTNANRRIDSDTPVYLAIDSDILRALTYTNILITEYGSNVDKRKIKGTFVQHNYYYLKSLLQYIQDDKIRILIVDSVFQESKHSHSLLSFIKDYCYFPNVNASNYQEKSDEATRLAYAYCKSYTNNGKEYDPPMKQVFVAEIKKHVPSNDCYIMAQATIENCDLLTANGKDFIFNERTTGGVDHDRVLGIVQVNIANGYFTMNDASPYPIAPKPFLIDTLSRILKNGTSALAHHNQDDNKVKADTILTI